MSEPSWRFWLSEFLMPVFLWTVLLGVMFGAALFIAWATDCLGNGCG